MPIFEYVCKDCNRQFEALVYGSQKAECPACHGKHLAQQLSVFSAHSGSARRSQPAPTSSGCCGGGACGMGGPGECMN